MSIIKLSETKKLWKELSCEAEKKQGGSRSRRRRAVLCWSGQGFTFSQYRGIAGAVWICASAF